MSRWCPRPTTIRLRKRSWTASNLADNRAVNRVKWPPMKWFRRWVFNGLAAISLLICASAIFLGIRGYFVSDSLEYRWRSNGDPWNNAEVGLYSGRGQLGASLLYADRYPRFTSPPILDLSHSDSEALIPPWFPTFWNQNVIWVVHEREYGNIGIQQPWLLQYDYRVIHVGSWSLALISAAIPALWIVRRYRRRQLHGMCAHCGYDLRATPDRCPECGSVPLKTIKISG